MAWQEWGGWTTPSTWIGGTGLLAGVAAIIKTIIDARGDRGKQRQTAEEALRDDLMTQNKDLRIEMATLRQELFVARKEMNEFARDAQARLNACEERAGKFREEAATFRDELSEVKGRMNAMVQYMQTHHPGYPKE